MSDHDDLVTPLRAVVQRSDATWVNQPSHLRRRLEQELGADARRHRAQIHQLVVAAEERVPVRLRRNGWSRTERDELSQMLVSMRGWTQAAAMWAVTTWAAALDLTDERPDGPPGDQRPAGAATSDRREIVPTVVPTDRGTASGVAPPGPTDLAGTSSNPATVPRPEEDRTVRREPHHPEAVAPPPTAAFSPPPIPALSPPPPPPPPSAPPALPAVTAKPNKLSRRVGQFLGHDVEVVYDVAVGLNPALLLLALPIGVTGLVAPVLLRGPLLMLFPLVVLIGRLLWPSRLLAVRGDHAWLLRKAGKLTAKPASVEFAGSRSEMVYAGARPFPSVLFGGQRMWFLFPITRAARRLPAADPSPERS